MAVVLHVSRSHGSWPSLYSARSSLARNASTSFRIISRRLNSYSPKTSLGSWMRSACFPLNIQGGCCHSREPTVWSQLIAGGVSARRKSRIDRGRKRCPQIRTAIWPASCRWRQSQRIAILIVCGADRGPVVRHFPRHIGRRSRTLERIGRFGARDIDFGIRLRIGVGGRGGIRRSLLLQL